MIIKQDFKKRQKVEHASALIALKVDQGKVGEEGADFGKCLEAEEMASLVDKSCDQEEEKLFTNHLSHCESCYQEWLSLKLAGEDQALQGGLTRSLKSSRVKKYRYIGSALAVAATVVVFLNISDQSYKTVYAPAPIVQKSVVEDEIFLPPSSQETEEDTELAPLVPSIQQRLYKKRKAKEKNVEESAAVSGEMPGGAVAESDDKAGAAFPPKGAEKPSPAESAVGNSQVSKAEVVEAEDTFGFVADRDVAVPAKITGKIQSKTSGQRRKSLRPPGKAYPQAETEGDPAEEPLMDSFVNKAQHIQTVPTSKTIDAWLQRVGESCRSGRAEMNFWTGLQLEGKNILRHQAAALERKKEAKAIAALELIREMEKNSPANQCKQLLELLADGEKNR